MSGISGPSGPGSVGGSGGVKPAEGATEAAGIGAAEGVAGVGVVAQAAAAGAVEATSPALALFDRIAAVCAQTPGQDRAAAVRLAVAAVIDEAIPGLDAEAQGALVAKVSEAVNGDPELSARLDRLLRVAG